MPVSGYQHPSLYFTLHLTSFTFLTTRVFLTTTTTKQHKTLFTNTNLSLQTIKALLTFEFFIILCPRNRSFCPLRKLHLINIFQSPLFFSLIKSYPNFMFQVDVKFANIVRIYLMLKISLAILVALLTSLTVCQIDPYTKHLKLSREIAEGMTLAQLVGQMIAIDLAAITDLNTQITNPDEAVQFALGSLLLTGVAIPTQNGNMAKIPSQSNYDEHMTAFLKGNSTNWKKLTDRFKDLGVDIISKSNGKYRIKFLLATDAVHGDQHTIGTVLFPHNVGLACAHNAQAFKNVGFWTKEGVKKVGFNHVYAPTVAVSHNPQWGRFYQTMGQQPQYIYHSSLFYIQGLQDVDSSGTLNGVLATAKHFIGDGATLYGCNMGNMNMMSSQQAFKHNIAGYTGAAYGGVGSVMASYSAINWIPNSINSQYLTGMLRDDVGFTGFVISDYKDLDFINSLGLPRTFMKYNVERDGYAAMINGGVDMLMISDKDQIYRLLNASITMTEQGYIPKVRLLESVTRILAVKMAMGLIQTVQTDQTGKQTFKSIVETSPTSKAPSSSSGNEYQDSLNAVRQSLVLLKNSNLLPATNLKSSIKYVILMGQKIYNLNRQTRVRLFRNFDNIGMQCGGWTVRWQGILGNDFWPSEVKSKINASSILDALKELQKENSFELVYADYSDLSNAATIDSERNKFLNDLKTKRLNMNSRNTLIIGTFGEFPYAESVGDVNIPYCKTSNKEGCLYDPGTNPYAPENEPTSLDVQISSYDRNVLSIIKEVDSKIPVVSVLLSGRPLIVQELLDISDATIAAWLPGTSGGHGIIDAIVGNYLIKPKSANTTNTLAFDWPKDMNQLQNFPNYKTDGAIPRLQNRLFSVGDGLSTDLSAEVTKE